MRDIAINLAASVIAGTAVWVAQFLLRYRRAARQRAFFGVQPHAEVLLSVSRHFSSPQPDSVHRADVATLVELATVVRECGGRPTLVAANEIHQEAGRVTEYCVGGPTTNPRTAAFLRSALPGVRFVGSQGGDEHGIRFGDTTYRMVRQHEEYAVLARTLHPATARPVFLLTGQTALSNLAAARYLVAHQRSLRGRRDFCLLLRVRESPVFGADHVELVTDGTEHAFRAPATPEPAPRPGATANVAERPAGNVAVRPSDSAAVRPSDSAAVRPADNAATPPAGNAATKPAAPAVAPFDERRPGS